MRRLVFIVLLISACWTGVSSAQTRFTARAGPSSGGTIPSAHTSDGFIPPSVAMWSDSPPASVLPVAPALPRMSAELTLEAYHQHVTRQATELASYSANILVRVQLPDTSQQGEFELERHYAAPHDLQFKAVRYTGDGFVKTNVITRLLQSEVDHVQKDDPSLTAISHANYKFSHKGSTEIGGRVVHVYQVKPRKKRASLFKGRIYLDAHTGSLVRAEGNIVKSPSFFVKNIEFVQDYSDSGSFTFPEHIHSEARARFVGRTIVDIYQHDYQAVPAAVETARQAPSL